MVDDDQFRAVAKDINSLEVMKRGNAKNSFRTSSLSTIATNGFSATRDSSTSTELSSSGSDTLSPPKPLEENSHETILNNSKRSIQDIPLKTHSHHYFPCSNSAMFSLSATALGPTRSVTSWMDTMVSPTSDLTNTEARAREETALSLLDLKNSGTLGPVKRPHELDDEIKEDLVVQSPKRTCFRSLSTFVAEFASERQAASGSKSMPECSASPAKQKSVRTPLPTCRSFARLNPPVPEGIRHCIEDSAFSQSYKAGRGWNPINYVPKTLLRPEDDLTIPINTILRAPDVSADMHHRRTTGVPAAVPNETLPTQVFLGKELVGATTSPIRNRAAGRSNRANSKTVTNDSSVGSRLANISVKVKAFSPEDSANPSDAVDTSSADLNAPASPVRREKWRGKSFGTLILEALRAAKSTNHILTTNQIAEYIEKYRLTTDMKYPALSQTIRAALMNKSRHRRKDGSWYPGLWVHCPKAGKRTGPYKLLPEGLAEDAVVPEDEEEMGGP